MACCCGIYSYCLTIVVTWHYCWIVRVPYSLAILGTILVRITALHINVPFYPEVLYLLWCYLAIQMFT